MTRKSLNYITGKRIDTKWFYPTHRNVVAKLFNSKQYWQYGIFIITHIHT